MSWLLWLLSRHFFPGQSSLMAPPPSGSLSIPPGRRLPIPLDTASPSHPARAPPPHPARAPPPHPSRAPFLGAAVVAACACVTSSPLLPGLPDPTMKFPRVRIPRSDPIQCNPFHSRNSIMGAETDFSSPEPDMLSHDHRSWKADMMSALGESVLFGRFLSEPLKWAKWSAFTYNRYLEEAARQSCPGSVAQKKAFFEAHYAKKHKSDSDADDEDEDVGHDLGFDAADSAAASSANSSCMMDVPAGEEARGVDSVAVDRVGAVADGLAEASQELDLSSPTPPP